MDSVNPHEAAIRNTAMRYANPAVVALTPTVAANTPVTARTAITAKHDRRILPNVIRLPSATATKTLLQVLADRRFHILIQLHAAVIVKRQHLHHNDRRNLTLRIDPEVRVVDAGPCVAARRAQVRVLLVGHRDLEAKAKLIAACAN